VSVEYRARAVDTDLEDQVASVPVTVVVGPTTTHGASTERV